MPDHITLSVFDLGDPNRCVKIGIAVLMVGSQEIFLVFCVMSSEFPKPACCRSDQGVIWRMVSVGGNTGTSLSLNILEVNLCLDILHCRKHIGAASHTNM